MSSYNEIEESIAVNRALLEGLEELLAETPDDPTIIQERQEAIAALAALEHELASLKQSAPQTSHDSSSKHEAFGRAAPEEAVNKQPEPRQSAPTIPPPPPADEPVQVFNVNDVVLAKWSGDKSFYEATITSQTGSANDPRYTVRFKIDNSTETDKRKHQVRAMPNNKKRKAEGDATATSTPPMAAVPKSQVNGAVISAPPAVDTSLIPKREPSKVSDGPTRQKPAPKKMKGSKQLENKQAGWQSFLANGPKKSSVGAMKAKDSQFRTPDVPAAKVGVIGSGKGMQKDQSRAKWGGGGSYRVNEDGDD